MRVEVSRSISQLSAGALVIASIVLLVAGLALLPAPASLPHALLVLGVLLAALAIYVSSNSGVEALGTSEIGNLAAVGERLEWRIEQLKDIAWELADNETRYRDLLDTQEDVISRRDGEGRLTFVNKAFCRVFGTSAAQMLGSEFRPTELAHEELTAAGGNAPPQRRYLQHVATAEGPRWFAVEEHTVADAEGLGFEVQTIGRDITEQRAFEVQLAEARDEAQAANRAKSRFLAAMSHEIRTPMNGILGMAGLLEETSLTPEQQTYTQAIDQSAKTLLQLIDEILDFSKIEAGKLELHKGAFALDGCVQSTVELLAKRAHEKDLEIAWTLDPNTPLRVIGDEARVRQILLNLIGNAVKFTDRGGILVSVVLLRQEDSKARVAIRVKDTGIGLSPEAMESVFAEFAKAEEPMAKRRGGTGLGLTISRSLARAMGGDIRVESQPGRGATFTAELEFETIDGIGTVLWRAPGSAVAGRVLLAFDRLIERRALAISLRDIDVMVDEADDLAATDEIAAAAASGVPIDLVIVDAQADPAEAGRALSRARAVAPGRKVRGIVLIDALARDNLKTFRGEGFDAYLVRPVRPQSLLAQIGFREAAAIKGSGSGVRAAAGATGSARRSAGSHVLIAEDNAINALLAQRLLEKIGCTSVIAADGEQAVALMRQALEGSGPPFDLVLMDVHMPKLDGLEAARTMRRIAVESGPRCGQLPPIVAVTANAFPEDRQRCLEAGLDDYLAKPFERAELEAVIARCVRRPLPEAGDDAEGGRAA
jgi:PAS domain S-box-containing protein